MARLTSQSILRIWEAGTAQDHAARALTLLTFEIPESPEVLGSLTVGERDRRLLALRQETFGPTLLGVSECSECAERVEFSVHIPDLANGLEAFDQSSTGEIEAEDWVVQYRLPTCEDLTAATKSGAQAAEVLARRCILNARQRGESAAAEVVADFAISAIGTAIVERDPASEIELDFVCPACGRAGQVLLDIVSYFWEEIRAQAMKLLLEVGALARAYGWNEDDILSLSPSRRQAYLQMAT